MYRIVICDDDENCIKLTEEKVREYCEVHEIDAVITPLSDNDLLMEYIREKRMFDAYILDIQMRTYSGLDIARQINEVSEEAGIIFLSAYSAYAVEACGMNVVRYVLKEQMDKELPLALDGLFKRLESPGGGKEYVISSQRKYVKLAQRDILYLYKEQKNVVFVLKDGREERERTTLQEVYEKLDHAEMFWLDRGVILNLYHVRRVTEDRVEMTDGHMLVTNQAHAADLKRKLHDRWRSML